MRPGKRHEHWKRTGPAGRGLQPARPIRDDIHARIETLISELLPATA